MDMKYLHKCEECGNETRLILYAFSKETTIDEGTTHMICIDCVLKYGSKGEGGK